MMHSLRGRLLWWLLLPLAAFVLIAGAMSYDTARRTADLVQDNVLVASARTIGEDVAWRNGTLVADVQPAALEIFASPSRDSVFYKVIDGHGRLLTGHPDLELPARHDAEPVFYDTSLDGRALRAVAYDRQLYNEGRTETVTVVVAKTTRSRAAMVATIWRPQLVRLSLMLLLAVALVYLGLTFELRPLMKLKDDVADRGPMELEPIRPERLHFELRPIVDAINQCIARLNTHTATQRRFIADAAHQMKTPLAGLRTQAEFALRHDVSPDVQRSLEQIATSSGQAARLVTQLLALARAENRASGLMFEPVEIATLARRAVRDWVQAALAKRMDLGYEGPDDDAPLDVDGNPLMLREMLGNLIDNAIRYTPEGGRITVRVRADRPARAVHLEVEDTGPGIPAAERERVLERFYRILGRDGDGSGLGLAIVREIVTQHGGALTLDDHVYQDAPRLAGTLVRITLPLHEPAPE